MKTVPPLEKRCRICKTKKLLSEFEINNNIRDKRENICKSCSEPQPTCPDCLEMKVVANAYTQLDLLLSLINDGLELPDDLLDLISQIAHRGELKCYCEACGKKVD
jgi:superfamily II helicase